MGGTIAGGKKAAAINLRKYGQDFYTRIGRKGGQNGHTGGVATVDKNGQHTYAIIAGRKGGLASSRAGIKNGEGKRRRLNG